MSLDGQTVPLRIVASKGRYIRVSVLQDLTLRAALPIGREISEVYDFVQNKKKFILKHLAAFRTSQPYRNVNDIRDGGSIQILSKRYRLTFLESYCFKTDKIGGDIFIFTRHADEPGKVREQIVRMLKSEADKKFSEILLRLWPKVARYYGGGIPLLKSRKMRHKWGVCSYMKGEIRLNIALYSAPEICIEYVIMHELAHLVYHNHGPQFKKFMLECCPDCRRIEDILKFQPITL